VFALGISVVLFPQRAHVVLQSTTHVCVPDLVVITVSTQSEISKDFICSSAVQPMSVQINCLAVAIVVEARVLVTARIV